MGKFTLNLIKREIYNGIFGVNSKSVKVQKESPNNPIDLNLHDYNMFDCNSAKWKEYLNNKYSNDAVHFNNCDFLFVHFANVSEILDGLYGPDKNIRETRANILNGKKRGKELRKSIADSLLEDYRNRSDGFGNKINIIMSVNKYIIFNYCKNIISLAEIISNLIESCRNDDTFPLSRENKESFLTHLKAYERKKGEIINDKDILSSNLSYIMTWLLLAALLREQFSEFAALIPNDEVVVQLRHQKEYKFLQDSLNKKITEELSIKIEQSQIDKVYDDFLLNGTYFYQDNSFSITLADLLQTSWVSPDRISKNIYVTGEGGIGKTLSLLFLLSNLEYNIYNIPALYIPLNKLGGYESVLRNGKEYEVEKNIIWYIKKHYYSQFEYIEKISSLDEDDSIRLILFLDGFNEISTINQYQLLRDIKNWKGLSSVQLIITSRALPDYRGDFGCFIADSLDTTVIDNYLSQYDVDFTGNRKTLSTPLLLQLCCQSEQIKKSLDSEYVKQLNWHSIETAADVFWNYLQYEIYRCVEKHVFSDNNITRISDYYYFVLLLCPYLSWKMTEKQIQQINEDELEKWIGEGIDFFGAEKNIYDSKIESVNRKTGYVGDNRQLSIKKDVYIQILESLNVLMIKQFKGDENEYVLMHQNLRDYMTALFLSNVLYRDKQREGFLSNIITSVGDLEILTYLSLILDDTTVDDLWESIKVKSISTVGYITESFSNILDMDYYLKNHDSKIMIKPDYSLFWAYREFVNWFLSFLGVKYKQDYSRINFSNMDLSYISLANCRNKSMQLTLSKNPSYFENTKISNYTFNKIGHTNKINVVKVIAELNFCISGDSDGKVYAWDLVNNKFLFIFDCRGTEVWDIAYIKKNDNYYVAVCTNESVDLFCIGINEFKCKNYNWIAPFYSIISEDYGGDNTFDNCIYIKDECRKICFYQCDDLYLFYALNNGNIGRFNVDNKRKESELLSETDTVVNRIEVLDDSRGTFCIAANEDFSINVWNVSKNELLKTIKVKKSKGANDDFSYIESSNSESKTTWNNKLNGITDFKVFYRNDYNIVFSDSEGGVHVSENIFEKGNKNHLLREGHDKCVNRIELFRKENKNWAISCSNDGTIIRWDLETEKRIGKKLKKHNDWVTEIKIVGDDKFVSYGHDNIVYIWDMFSGEAYRIKENSIDWILCGEIYSKFEDDWLVTGDASGAVILWNISEKMMFNRFPGLLNDILDVKVFKKNDGKEYIALASADGVARIWDMNEKICVATLEGHQGWINAICPCKNGNLIITCGSDKTVRIFDITDLNNPQVEILSGHSDWVLDVDILSDNNNSLKFLTCSYDGTFILWERYFNTFKATCIGRNLRSSDKTGCKYIKANVNGIKEYKCETKYNDTSVHEAGIKIIRKLDDNRIIIGGYDGKVVVWALDKILTDQGRIIARHKDWVRDIIFIKDYGKKHVLSSSVDGRIIKYNFEDLNIEKVFYLSDNSISCMGEILNEEIIEDYINDKSDNNLCEKNGIYIDKMLLIEDEAFIGLTNKGYMLLFYADSELDKKIEDCDSAGESWMPYNVCRFGSIDNPMSIFNGITNIAPYNNNEFVVACK